MRKTKEKQQDIEYNTEVLFNLVVELIKAVHDLKENECQNSGYNWYGELVERNPKVKKVRRKK